MADLSKVKLGNETYNLKDAEVRKKIITAYAQNFQATNAYGNLVPDTSYITLYQNIYEENPYLYRYWFGKDPCVISLIVHDSEGNAYHTGIYKAVMDHYILYLEQLDGENNKLLFSSNDVINQNLGWSNPTKVYYRGAIIIPAAETMANVKTTIAKYGLDTTTEFTSPVVGTGAVGQTVSMPS